MLAAALGHAGTMLEGVFGSAYMLAAVSLYQPKEPAVLQVGSISSKVSQLARVQKCVE